ncbi:class I glutamine amidotransferase-like protein [Hymenopellis radicata]|nr:class I glutamine amidotransferase-like protein [Hymenopellis radicata]
MWRVTTFASFPLMRSIVTFLFTSALLQASVFAGNGAYASSSSSYLVNGRHVESLPVNFGIVVFPSFTALDVFGPLEALNMLALQVPINLAIIAPTLEPVTTKPQSAAMNTQNSNCSESLVPTHTFDEPPADLEVLIVPGGIGTRNPSINSTVDYVAAAYPSLRYLITVCTGATIAAKAGVLDGKNATTNKLSWTWATSTGSNVNWISHARWVVDGNIYTTSGVSAGIDGFFGFYGRPVRE